MSLNRAKLATNQCYTNAVPLYFKRLINGIPAFMLGREWTGAAGEQGM